MHQFGRQQRITKSWQMSLPVRIEVGWILARLLAFGDALDMQKLCSHSEKSVCLAQNLEKKNIFPLVYVRCYRLHLKNIYFTQSF